MPSDPPPAASTAPRRLLLLRHAKAGPHDAADDHARDLAPRGRDQLAAVAAFMRAGTLAPDRVLLSDSLRTRRTWELLAPLLPPPFTPPPVEPSSRLYLADAATLLAALREAPAGARSLLLVAHNPGLHALVLALAGKRGARDCGLADGMPTAALAVLDLADDAPWSALSPARVAACAAFRP